MPKICPAFAKDGSCSYGSGCKYIHIADQKASSKAERAEEMNRVESLKNKMNETTQALSCETSLGSIQKHGIQQKDAVASFFSKYPTFHYDPQATSITNFYRLCDHFAWSKHNASRKKSSEAFGTAMVLQFNGLYGIDADDGDSWQKLCAVLKIDPIPQDWKASRQAVRTSHFNFVDLVDAENMGGTAKVFETQHSLNCDIAKTGSFFPKKSDFAGGLLRHLLQWKFGELEEPPQGKGEEKKKGRKRKMKVAVWKQEDKRWRRS